MEEHESIGLTDEVARYLEATRVRLGLEKPAMKALDLGCKDGSASRGRGGCGSHIFPAPLRPIEGHLFMLFVHWLPKNRARGLAIRALVSLGIEPRWKQLAGAPARIRAETYFRYSCEATYYRTFDQWRHAFERYGLIATEVSTEHPKLARHRLLHLPDGQQQEAFEQDG